MLSERAVKALLRKILYPDSIFPMVVLGSLFGVAAVVLALAGNPVNTGLCVSCFFVNVAGALGLHSSLASSYLRPEILAILIGSFLVAFAAGEFKSRGSGLSPLKFLGGAFLIIGCEVFIGCPIKMLLRIAGGGVVALAGLLGLAGGVILGSLFLREGFSLFPARVKREASGMVLPLAAFLVLFASTSGVYAFAAGVLGSSARHAPFALSLGLGLAAGAIGQRTRFCITGGIKNLFLGRVYQDISVVTAFFVTVLIFNLLTGGFRFSYLFEPGGHTDLTWAFLSMGMVGFGSILIGGCPFRQLVLAGTGEVDAGWAVLGMLAGAALSVTLGLSSTAAGVSVPGKLAVLGGWMFFLGMGLLGKKRK